MIVEVMVANDSVEKRLFRRDVLTRLASRVCSGEMSGAEDAAVVEVSVLFCDDDRIRELNKAYRDKDTATDVLSFEQAGSPDPRTRILGDIVISLETVVNRNDGNRSRMRDDVRLLFCHGMLHLLGFDHATAATRTVMNEKQAQYLGVPIPAAWRTDS